MALYDIPNSTAGIDSIIVQTVSAIPGFMPMLLFFIYLTILLGGSIRQKRRIGTSDLPMWATMAGVGTLLVALPLTLSVGLIEPITLSVVIVATVFSGLWLFLDKNRNEI